MTFFQNLMLIDDDEDDREIFLSVIESMTPSPVCITAVNGVDALKKLMDAGTKPDLIFLDLNMPVMNGQQFLKEIKHSDEFKKIPVIILSTSSDRKSILETIELGANHFITKPDKFKVWEETLREVLSNPLT